MIIKTRQMQELERDDPQRRDIREILRDAYEAAGNVSGASTSLGIAVGTFSTWVEYLGGEIRSEVVFPALDGPEPTEECAA